MKTLAQQLNNARLLLAKAHHVVQGVCDEAYFKATLRKSGTVEQVEAARIAGRRYRLGKLVNQQINTASDLLAELPGVDWTKPGGRRKKAK